MLEDLHITLIQSEIRWNDMDFNLRHISKMLQEEETSDLIILPEMFATGFIVEDLEHLAGGERILAWMNTMAAIHHTALIGSVAFQFNRKWYNRLFMVEPDGRVQHYDKRHLFVKSQEPTYFEQGNDRVVFEYKGWRICPQICYDLRFPTWSRNEVRDEQFRYDVLLYVANWPAVRAEAWNTLLKARAIENQAYVVAANCVGTDSAGNKYSGDSQVVDAMGRLMVQCREGEEQCVEAVLSHKSLSAFRERFPVWQDWD